jgi:hypothetical protein
MSSPYSIYFDNTTGRVVINKKKINNCRTNNSPPRRFNSPLNRANIQHINQINIPLKKEDEEFQKNIDELYKFTDINCPEKVNIEKNIKNISQANTIFRNINNISDIPKKEDEKINRNSNNNINNNNINNNNINNINNINSNINNNINNNSIHRNIFEKNINEKYFQNNPKIEVRNEQNNLTNNNINVNNIDKFQKDITEKYFQNKLNIENNTQKQLLIKKDLYQDPNDTIYNQKNIYELENTNFIKNQDDNIVKNQDDNFIFKKDLIYGVKKTILSDFNYLYHSSNCNDFIIGLNKNLNKNNSIFDCFYLFPNISEINTKSETNIINEKKIDIFKNINNSNDIQYFPIDFVACGITVPLKSKNKSYTKLIIKNIFWNIFQSINIKNYSNTEILSIIPGKNDFLYKDIKLQINFELHSQISNNIIDQYQHQILPYKNLNIKSLTPANSCLYKVENIKIDTLNGSYFDNIEINLIPELNIQCALLCIKISVPDESLQILRGVDKNNSLFYGNIPFSQFILNFDYDVC